MADEEEPLKITYCGVCSLPSEYCEYSPSYDQCKDWWKTTNPDEYEEMIAQVSQDVEALDGASKKRQTRGGKGMAKIGKKKQTTGPKKIEVALSQRSKKKYVTVVVGLKTFEIDVKKAAKLFGQKFACGTSVTGEDEIIIQGDVKDGVIDFIQEKWPEVDDDSIEDVGTKK